MSLATNGTSFELLGVPILELEDQLLLLSIDVEVEALELLLEALQLAVIISVFPLQIFHVLQHH